MNSTASIVENKFVTKPGPVNGLYLELYVGDPTSIYSLPWLNGARVIVHNKTEKPSFYDGLSVNVGAFTDIAISRRYSSKLEQP